MIKSKFLLVVKCLSLWFLVQLSWTVGSTPVELHRTLCSLAKLKDDSTINRAADQAIFALKEESYWKAPETPKKEEQKGNDD